MEPWDAVLTTYTGEEKLIASKILVNVQYKEQNKDLYLYVVERDRPCLQIWLLNTTVNSNAALINLLDQYQDIFTEGWDLWTPSKPVYS